MPLKRIRDLPLGSLTEGLFVPAEGTTGDTVRVPLKRIRELPLGSAAEGLFVSAEGTTGDTVRVPLGPASIPIVEGSTYAVQVETVQSILLRWPLFIGLKWIKILGINIGTTNYRGARGLIWMAREGAEGPYSPTMAVFHVGRNGNGTVALRVGLYGAAAINSTFQNSLQDIAIVGDPATGLYEIWVQALTTHTMQATIWRDSNVTVTIPSTLAPQDAAPTGAQTAFWSGSSQSVVLPYGTVVSQNLSPSNGHIRLDNGMQLAWCEVASSAFAAQTGSGTFTAPYTRAYTWTYPAAFAEPPIVQATIDCSGMGAARISSRTATSVQLIAQYASNGMAFNIHAYALGRWRL
ncbi:hypothetical protein [Thermus albus]|uniref:hypothetical protein n=1 Tax=Thermus albus TaxID=2908146 RepID=UPI001FAB0414|nr:hypothetical protein [Thermus albus]